MSQVRKKASKNRRHSAPKAVFSFRRHILPPFIGLLVMAAVFAFLNSQILIAKAHYRFDKPQPLPVPAAEAQSTKSPDPAAGPQILIPSIGIKSPIIFEKSTSDEAVQAALQKGVDHYGTTANPGEPGNSVIFGHSSGQLWAAGGYKYVFTLLDKTKAGDQILVDYKGTRYTYKITGSEIILPTNLSVLSQASGVPLLTLITCSPVGTNKYRLVVHAVQTNPKPVVAAAAPKNEKTPAKAEPSLPGNGQSSFWRTVFSWL